jgi:hypothetical protein
MSGFNTEIEICPMGLNLWNLLLAEPETQAAREGTVNGADSRVMSGNSPDALASNIPMLFGQLSHGTTLSFFGAAKGKEVMGQWKLQNPARAFDKIKAYLQAEMQKAEWEILEDTEWDGILDDEEPVLVRGQQRADADHAGRTPARPTQAPEPTAPRAARRESLGAGSEASRTTTASAKTQGANGWTKLRNRNSEAAQPTP